MPEKETPSLAERLARLVFREALSGITRPAEKFAKRIARSVGLVLAGIVVSLLGVGFLAIGAVKWLTMLMPGWLAWLLVGLILFLLGATLTLTTFAGSRS